MCATLKKEVSETVMKNARKIVRAGAAFLTVLLVGVLLLSGCASEKTYKDGLGAEIKVKGVPKRIVSLSPAHTETLFALGLGDKVVGVTDLCNRPSEAQGIEKVGDAFNLNLEKLVSLKPDLVICPGTRDFVAESVKEVQRAGLLAYVSGPETIDEILEDIKNLATILAVEKAGEKLAGDISDRLASLAGAYQDDSIPSVFLCVDPDLWTAGPGSFVHDLLVASGGKNIVEDTGMQYFKISMEELLSADPDIILVTVPEEYAGPLLSQPGWASLTAVKNDKVFFLDPDLVSRPGPSVVEAVKEIGRYLHPGGDQ